MAAKTPKTQVSSATKSAGRFQKGFSGNPNGRPVGSRNRTTLALQAILDGEGELIIRKAIEMALAGDMVALRLCLERLVPVRHERPVAADLSELNGTTGAAGKLGVIIAS